jgi:hypothetical protein
MRMKRMFGGEGAALVGPLVAKRSRTARKARRLVVGWSFIER